MQALIRVVSGQPIDEATIEKRRSASRACAPAPKAEEGLTAFLEKRKPNWLNS